MAWLDRNFQTLAQDYFLIVRDNDILLESSNDLLRLWALKEEKVRHFLLICMISRWFTHSFLGLNMLYNLSADAQYLFLIWEIKTIWPFN